MFKVIKHNIRTGYVYYKWMSTINYRKWEIHDYKPFNHNKKNKLFFKCRLFLYSSAIWNDNREIRSFNKIINMYAALDKDWRKLRLDMLTKAVT